MRLLNNYFYCSLIPSNFHLKGTLKGRIFNLAAVCRH
uniref:Uncharacterized protein n=1 Tax=Anguilla anguilla TaxID=7936 RepID=A0A0E9R436_ANGAN